ncbi:hypothetical protein [Rhizobium mesoamericanum]|uniref:Uncharacterized protein n=1 Tax=Rhizobium mesoamericanum STM3625 TaxID=1211777 RepID=K0Q5N6_9HYPH|nr:hypothetical protein BN77_p11409 [Rhizobium mesoamericanum STM3625]
MQIYAFDMNCLSHINHGMWTHPRDTSLHFTDLDLDYWVDFACTASGESAAGLFPGRHRRRRSYGGRSKQSVADGRVARS